MTSTLGYGILGLLARGPLTGYEVARRLQTPVGYFWSARHSQIYPELARLEADRLVRHAVVSGPGPRDNKRYSLTPRGRTALRRWVVSEPPPAPAKSELLLRVYSIWLSSPSQARTMLEAERAKHVAALSTYAGIAEANADATFDSPGFGDLATVRAGVGYEQHTIAWLDWLLERLPQ
jgi:DNA-binding PadR family transcriptional regulator